ncbi:hypothetical protein EI94DRAFT_702629 [Lactarius quietus]|nr:hypothetical protein EI94DRAFT_702629 [Lactarius quietus]
MSLDEPGSKAAPVMEITEDEAALYDRQIRLWGLEAQQRSVFLSACGFWTRFHLSHNVRQQR